MKSIAVYCGSNSGNKPIFQEAANSLGNLMASKNIELIYGGAKVGLMGCIANAAMQANGRVVGVLPHFLSRKEVIHNELAELIMVDTMQERKTIMYERAEAFIAMPGGYGTFEELFEMVTWLQLGLHQKPIGILNTDGYYNFLIQQFDVMTQNGFLSEENRALIQVDEEAAELLKKLSSFKAPDRKRWISEIEQT